MPVRSLSAEQVYDSIVQAAGRRDPLDRSESRIMEQRRVVPGTTRRANAQADRVSGRHSANAGAIERTVCQRTNRSRAPAILIAASGR